MHARLQPRPRQSPHGRPSCPLRGAPSAAPRAEPRAPGTVLQMATASETVADYARSHAAGVARTAAGPNRTGLPNGLKHGIETLSGISLDDVRVHRNSSRPAQLKAHAYAQGSDIHLAPGKERHLPHEAWHIVQQKQGRVGPTARAGNLPVNDDLALEGEADRMGAQAARAHPSPGGATATAPAMASPSAAVAQCITVDEDDIGESFDVTTVDGVRQEGELEEIRGGGWYLFDVGLVRGQRNIHGRAGAMVESDDSDLDSGSDSDVEESSDDEDMGGTSSSITYSNARVSTSDGEFDIGEIARANNVSVRTALMMIRNSYRVVPRTLRLHYPFGSKTMSRGGEAFDTPSETTKQPQGMIGYRAKDYGKKHKKVGKDYDDWADELSDSDEDEEDKKDRARDILAFLNDDETMKFSDMTSRQKAALGGLLSVALLSDPMRTEFNSRRTERDFIRQLRARARGETSFHAIFGSKTGSTFLPARKGGSKDQRKALRDETSKATKELQGRAALWQNNCLINAICWAAHGRSATLIELLNIRFNLNNVGEMMVATPQTVGVIRQVLGINNQILVRYPVGSGALNETIIGIPPTLTIYHTGGDHFQHTLPLGVFYQ
ncbi:DUF4157 domain-containing protein [Sphingomonas sp. CBMAI 2297]|uniref:eCIS core domain-containing protein n=1 Tax=Sphingomonas sp. CBMAI 2297 TaxID=2991720 RepID=UPI00245459A8|nr:DUF4157 domain-containing protein [Sphingomonas sp. CBMAI 2297]MDH4745551.1 DUF4157 domain-containing protein [Sphingomonas sp. CBMAI 2297]